MTTSFILFTKTEAQKISKIQNKGLEEHLLRRLREYQKDLFNLLYDPEYYDYDYDTIKSRIDSVISQLQED